MQHDYCDTCDAMSCDTCGVTVVTAHLAPGLTGAARPPRPAPARRAAAPRTLFSLFRSDAAPDSQHFLSILFLFFQAAAAGCGVPGRDGRDGDSEVI